jgi:SAM-dependent methyltransferase
MSHQSLIEPDYGIDAPPVVRNLAIAGACCVVLGFVLYSIPVNAHRGLAFGVLLVMLFSALCFWITTAAMIWSSKRGKLKARERLVDSLHLKGEEVILDAGCGRGLLLNCAAKRLKNGKAIGLDLWQSEDQSGNAPQVTLANSRVEGVADRVEIISGDMRQMPFADESIDVAMSSIAIHNIVDKDGRQKAIGEIGRVLRSGGKILLLDFQNVDEYADRLLSLGWNEVNVSRHSFWFFPPVRILTGTKPDLKARENAGLL